MAPARKKRKTTPDREAATCIGSRRAAELIRDRSKPLIVLTVDASGGGNCSGIAAILRKISPDRASDNAKVVLGRLPWDESSAAESGAIASGLEALLEETNLEEYRLLVLSDCHSALDLFCPEKRSSLRDGLVDAPKWIDALARVCRRVGDGVVLSKIRSVHTNTSGFFDHEAADMLSAKARDPETLETHSAGWIEGVPPLDRTSIEWLKTSDEPRKKKTGGSGPRKKRCEVRIRNELKLEWFSL